MYAYHHDRQALPRLVHARKRPPLLPLLLLLLLLLMEPIAGPLPLPSCSCCRHCRGGWPCVGAGAAAGRTEQQEMGEAAAVPAGRNSTQGHCVRVLLGSPQAIGLCGGWLGGARGCQV